MSDFSFFQLTELLDENERFNWYQIMRIPLRHANRMVLKKLAE